MNKNFMQIINSMLENYAFKQENLRTVHAASPALAGHCVSRHFANLVIGIELLEGVAVSAGDYQSADAIRDIFIGLCAGKMPQPFAIG
ncbi:hypothetical protein PHA77_01860 [Edwardsiella tarda]|uniref:hypothetical protein n=1 Tax=Edwardsiella tarda TaxID=636 RepID=UPI0024444D9B|nr:hypothetical protein [Edwardsiella tarda]WGE29438.1 hypothetical protein PHA77_01860 [Edwardsiella tarda]